jgi:hypothetical protein
MMVPEEPVLAHAASAPLDSRPPVGFDVDLRPHDDDALDLLIENPYRCCATAFPALPQA